MFFFYFTDDICRLTKNEVYVCWWIYICVVYDQEMVQILRFLVLYGACMRKGKRGVNFPLFFSSLLLELAEKKSKVASSRLSVLEPVE